MLTFGFSFEYNGKIALVDERYLKPEFRRLVIGEKTMNFIAEQSVKSSINSVLLEVEKHNEAGKSLSLKSGYQHNVRILLSKKSAPEIH